MANKEFATHLEFKGVRRYFKDSRFEPVTKTSNMTSPVGLDSNGKLWTKEGEGGGGISDHSQLSNRDAANQHPMSAITGLENEFAQISDAFSDVFAGLGAKLSDAPSDGKQYARQNGAWSEVESGGGGRTVFLITVTENDGVYTPDKTYTEALTAYEAGLLLVMRIGQVDYYLQSKYSLGISFSNGTQMFEGDLSSETYLFRTSGEVLRFTESGTIPSDAQISAWNGKLSDAPIDGKQYARRNGAWAEVQSGGGTSDHSQLSNRDAENQHPMSAITGLQNALDDKFDKTGGQITGNVIASGAVGGSNLYADNGRGAVAIFSAEGTATQTEAAVTNEDGDLAPLLVADPSDDAHAASKYYVDRRVNEKLSDAPSDGKQYARKDGVWSEVESGGGANSEIYHGWYDSGSITLTDVPDGVDVYQDFFEGLYLAGKTVILSIEEINGVWNTSFRLTKVGESREGNFVLFSQLEEYNDSSDMILATIRITEDNSIVYHAADLSDYVEKRDLGELSDLDTTDKSNIVAAINEIAANGGTSDHSQLTNRDAANQHPMSAITGLANELSSINDAFSDVFSNLNTKLSDAPIDGKQYARKNGAWAEVQSGGGGTSDHSQLTNRDAINQHPMSAITGLENEFGMVRDTFGDVFSDLNNKLSDAPINGKQYARRNGAWVEVQSGGGGGADTVITGLYDTYEGTVTLDFPTGTTDYFDYINGLLQQNNDVRIEVDAACGDWTAVFRHSKTSDDGQGRGYHVFQNSELMDDGSTNAGFLWIDATSVTYVQDDRGSADNPTEKLVKDNFDALKAYIDDQFKPHTIWEVEDAEDGITYSSGKSRQLSGSAWKLTGLNLLDNEGKRYVRLKFYFRGCVGTVQDQEGAGVILEMSLDERFRTPRSNLFCATSVGYAINDNGVKAGVVANISVADGWNNAKCATTYTNFNTTGTTALERDYRLYRIEAYKN